MQKCIRLYINQRGKDTIPDLFVRVYRNGERRTLNKSVFNYWCKIFAKMLYEKEGKEYKINPHCFRHSRLDNLKVQGVPLEKLKSLANHSDISTTESYLKIEVKKILQRYLEWIQVTLRHKKEKKMDRIDVLLKAFIATFGGFCGYFLGGWDATLKVLVTMAIIDYLTG